MLKKIALICVLLAMVACSNPQNKEAFISEDIVPIEPIRNPEWRFYLEAAYFLKKLKNPFNDYTYSEVWIEDLNKKFNSTDDKLTLLQLYIYLTDFVGKDISKEAFKNLETLFDSARRKGYKSILRFAYDDTYNATDATFDDIFQHLNQLAPFIKKHIGMIDVWQMGFIADPVPGAKGIVHR